MYGSGCILFSLAPVASCSLYTEQTLRKTNHFYLRALAARASTSRVTLSCFTPEPPHVCNEATVPLPTYRQAQWAMLYESQYAYSEEEEEKEAEAVFAEEKEAEANAVFAEEVFSTFSLLALMAART